MNRLKDRFKLLALIYYYPEHQWAIAQYKKQAEGKFIS